jgi:mono/diheme cytochrome c family protein
MATGALPMHRRVAVLLGLMVSAVPVWAGEDGRRPGEYLFRAAVCAGCHTDAKHNGAPLAGGPALTTPFGIFYAPNITPDPDTGIGRWSEADFIRALRQGMSPAGDHYYPAFPYTSYTRLTDADLRALKVYIFSLKPVRQANRPHRLPWYLRWRPLLGIWKALFFRSGAFQAQPDQSAIWNRGAYLVTAVAHCGECHTPRHFLGGFKSWQQHAGTRDGPEGSVVPNITPDKKTGIGRWRASELVEYLETGATPEGDSAGDLMAEIIDNSLQYLRKEDLRAIAAYTLSLPPIEQAVRKDKEKKSEAGY